MLEVCIIFHLPACLVVQHEGGCMHALSLTEQVVQHGGRGTHSLNLMKGRDVLNISS